MRKLVRITLFGSAALVLLAIAIFLGLTLLASSRLTGRVALLRAAGKPVSIAEIMPEPVPDEQNAAYWLEQAAPGIEEISTAQATARREHNLSWQWPRDAGENQAYYEHVAPVIEEQEPTFRLLQRAADCSSYVPDRPTTLTSQQLINLEIEHGKLPRSAAVALIEQARCRLHEGKTDAAIASCITALRLSRRISVQPTILTALIAVAMRGGALEVAHHALRVGPISAATRAALERELAQFDGAELFRASLETERALGLSTYREFGGPIGRLASVYFNDDATEYLAIIDRAIELSDEPYSALASYLEQIEREKQSGWRHRMAMMFVPAVVAEHQAIVRVDAQTRALRVLLAIKALEESGPREQIKIAELSLPADATTDPYTGEPLKLKRTPEGWAVYAVGEDLEDDGGAETPEDITLAAEE